MINLIAAFNRQRLIGENNALVWDIPGDLNRFRRLTRKRPIIMGRKTWESLPRRPLPDRVNIVISRDPSYRAEGAHVVPTLDAALTLARQSEGGDEVWVIGGGAIFELALPIADRIYATIVHDDRTPADGVYFPDFSEFSEVVPNDDPAENGVHEENGVAYEYVTLARPSATP